VRETFFVLLVAKMFNVTFTCSFNRKTKHWSIDTLLDELDMLAAHQGLCCHKYSVNSLYTTRNGDTKITGTAVMYSSDVLIAGNYA
jgi:hypothetical protein